MKKLTYLLLAIIILLGSCNKINDKKGLLKNVEEDQILLRNYFSAATHGVISAGDKLIYVLKKPISKELSKEDLALLIELNPLVTGTTTISNGTIIKFSPDQILTPDQKYKVNINLELLGGEYQKDISYDIRTFKQDVKVIKGGIIINSDNSISILLNILTADKVDIEKLKQCFKTDANNQLVSKTTDTKYQLELIYKNSLSKNSFVKYDFKPIQAESDGELKFNDFDIKEFSVLTTKNHPSLKEYHIYFSQRLDKKKDLTGLVKVNGKNGKISINDNRLIVFTSGYQNEDKIKIELFKGIVSTKGKKLLKNFSFTIDNEIERPVVIFLNEGNYFPSTNDLKIPIKTKSLEKVRITVIEIKQENVKHFLTWENLQNNDFYSLRMFGKPIYNEVVSLKDGFSDEEGWKVFGIDLNDKIEKNPGSIYNISLSIDPSHTNLSCKDDLKKYNYKSQLSNESFFNNKNSYYNNYYYGDYDWRERNNPCNISFYRNQNNIVQRNFICSNYSIIAKRAGYDYHLALTDIVNLNSIAKGEITLYDLQGEEISKGFTSDQGLLKLNTKNRQAAVLKLKKDNHVTYMSLDDAQSNPLTEFNISGNRSSKDGQFFIYTEREVWRPGDSIYLNLMINRDFGEIPTGLPIKMMFYNTENLIINEQVQSIDLDKNQIYSFVLHTNSNSKSGLHRAIFEVGTQSLRKNIRIENIKPNTAEILYEFDNLKNNVILSNSIKGLLKAQYLTGFALKKTNIKTEAICRPINNLFENYKDYKFRDNRTVSSDKFMLFKVTTDQEGSAKFNTNHNYKQYNSPIRMFFETETTLSGGGTNKEGKSIVISPFKSYVGAKRNEGRGWRNNYLLDENPRISLVSINQDGALNKKEKKIEYTIQKHLNYWWIDKYSVSSNSHFRNDRYWSNIEKKSITINGKGEIIIKQGVLKKGAYRVLIKDKESNHQTMVYFTVYNGQDRIPGAAPYVVEFETDKDEYKTSESIILQLPNIEEAKALISIERNNKVLEQLWFDIKDDNTIYLSIQKDWSPNIYIHVTVLQKYEQDKNDLPLRMYGVKSIKVNTEEPPLKPIIDISDKLESNTKYQFNITEKNGQPMEYTIAVVDEGLLNLTGFATPDPQKHFNGKFPLLVKTWDIYKYLMMFFKGDFAGILSIGGDDAYKADALPEVNRFEAVVMHFGPFKLNKNKSNQHELDIPNYIGKLRFMVVGCNDKYFGNSEKKILVKNPLMVQSQFPRALNVSDKMSLPITILRDDNNIKNAKLSIKSTPGYTSGLDISKTINLENTDQLTENIDVEVLNKSGVMNVDISISGNGKTMIENTEIAVNYPNSYESSINSKILKKEEVYNFKISPRGYVEVFESKLQISGLKVPKFTEYAEDLVSYPYGCLEQTVSNGFGQLYLDKILVLTPAKNRERLEHLQAIINKLTRFQKSDGKFNYWQSGYYHSWSDLYTGNFLVELSNQSLLTTNSKMQKRWIKAHQKAANRWQFTEASSEYVYEKEVLMQAYRLFVLAKAGSPAKSAMNKFSSSVNSTNPLTWWLLSGAYILSNYDTKANDLLIKAENFQKSPKSYHYSWSFGNKSRDLAIMVEILSYFKDKKKLSDLYYNKMVDRLNDRNWVNTHTKGYAFLAAYKYFGSSLDLAKTINYSLEMGSENNRYSHSSIEPNVLKIKPEVYGQNIKLKNETNGKIFVYQIDRYIDDNLVQEAKNSNLDIVVTYYNSTKGEIGLKNLNIGDDISISVAVRNITALSMENLALNLKMPSGWELINPRMYSTQSDRQNSSSFVYQDFKDDRVYTFFNMGAGNTQNYNFKAKASYSGDFFMPSVSCENMYDGDIFAKTKTQRILVGK